MFCKLSTKKPYQNQTSVVVSMATFGYLETMVFTKFGIIQIAVTFTQGGLILFIPYIADALEKQQRKYVLFKVGGINHSAQDIGGAPRWSSSSFLVIGYLRFN
jgi:hypothetical protein